MKEKFRNRRAVMYKELNALDGVECGMPGGAFYMFPDFSYYLNKKTIEGKILQDTFDLSDYILADAKVVTVAGDGFGANKYLRFANKCNYYITFSITKENTTFSYLFNYKCK